MSLSKPLIIDIHGHYTTAPKALENWRNRQIAGIKDPALRPKVSDLSIDRKSTRLNSSHRRLSRMPSSA